MSDHPPVHPGLILRDRVLPGLRLSVTYSAKKLPITRQTLHAILAAEAPVTAGMALRLRRLSDAEPDAGLSLHRTHDLRLARQRLGGMLQDMLVHPLPSSLRIEIGVYDRPH